MPVISVNGVDITFPFEPYQVQLDYMKKVIECLQLRTNAVLESPTGTGKTLSLLCSSLAWLNHYNSTQAVNDLISNPKPPPEAMQMPPAMAMLGAGPSTSAWNSKIKIIYASRTHSQLSQAMAELKRTHYADVRVTVLGSRDQLCINPVVQKEEKIVTKNLLCRILVSGRECAFHNNVEMTKTDPTLQTVVDIEDLVKSGKRLRSCPYYLTKELQKDSDIVFAPYNYLLDPKIRKTQDISLDNAIVILDEGHNIEKVSEEVMSTKLSSTQIAYCIEEVTEVMKVRQERGEDPEGLEKKEENSDELSVSELCLLKTVLLELEKVIDEFPLQPVPGKPGPPTKALPGSEIFPLLAKAEITEESCPPLIEILYKVSQFATAKSESPFARKGQHLQAFQDFVVRVFQSKSSAGSCFKLFIEPDVPKKTKSENAWAPKTSAAVSSTAKVLNYWCFNPGFGLRALMDMGVRSVILTSGTLSPLDATISELGIPVGVQLENPHIIQPNQVYISVLGKGPASVELKSTYENRENKQYVSELGQTILNCVRIIPHGVLVFFPSYSVMNKAVEAWQDCGIWSNISKHKALFIEQSNKLALNNVIEEFYKAVDERGAVLFAVCRGKISEGLDFSDNRARAVIITGIPYPPVFDPRVTLKKEYLDENRRTNKLSLDGQRWYQLEAIRAVNQALGRVLRHSQDYGALILCDSRFYGSATNNLSAWLQPLIFKAPSFGAFMQKLVGFFRSSRIMSECNVKPRPTIEYCGASRALPKKSSDSSTAEKNDEFLNGYAGSSSTPGISKKREADKPMSLFERVELSSQKTFQEPEREKLPEIKCSTSEPDMKRAKLTVKNLKLHDIEFARRMKKVKTQDERNDSIKNYLIQVKSSIPAKEYGIFSVTICKYAHAQATFPELIEVLKQVFPHDNKTLRPLFSKFKPFLKSEHLSLFEKEAASYLNSSQSTLSVPESS